MTERDESLDHLIQNKTIQDWKEDQHLADHTYVAEKNARSLNLNLGLCLINIKWIRWFLIFSLGVLVGKYLLYEVKHVTHTEIRIKEVQVNVNQSLKFNETGYPIDIVPNIVHYILFTIHEIKFVHFLSLLSVLKNHKPDKIYIHCDCSQLSGDFYPRIMRIANKTNTLIIMRTIERPTHIFGKKLSTKWLNWHSSDIMRIRVLQEFGGIYLDTDEYVVKSLDVFRKYEMTLDWDYREPMSCAVLIAHPNSRFLKLYLDGYKDYHSDEWFYNSGLYPTDHILFKQPHLVHRVLGQFGANGPRICPMLFSRYDPKWKESYYTIHLFIRGNVVTEQQWCFSGKIPKITTFNESMAPTLSITFGEMLRLVLDFEKTTLQ